jgi:hypothetical protein
VRPVIRRSFRSPSHFGKLVGPYQSLTCLSLRLRSLLQHNRARAAFPGDVLVNKRAFLDRGGAAINSGEVDYDEDTWAGTQTAELEILDRLFIREGLIPGIFGSTSAQSDAIALMNGFAADEERMRLDLSRPSPSNVVALLIERPSVRYLLLALGMASDHPLET